MSERRRVLLPGASGLVGRAVMARVGELADIALIGLARREVALPKGARMELVLAPGEEWGRVVGAIAPDAVICAIGTTRAKAGSEEAFRAVDHDLVLALAGAAKAAGTRHFVHVSSVGADTASRAFYLRVKAETERALRQLKFRRLDILRPGLLIGARPGDERPAEKLAQRASPLTDIVMRGSLSKYRSIRAEDLAAAALQCTREKAAGSFVHERDSLRRLARQLERQEMEKAQKAQKSR